MIKIENVEVYGWEAAIRGMRNPMNSWDKSDSDWEFVEDPSIINPNDEVKFVAGENDLKLMKSLAKAGTDHGKFLRMINVTCDITAPLYWWKEFDTYKVGTVANSCSTMHKIAEKKFTLDDFSHEHLLPNIVGVGGATVVQHGMGMLYDIIFMLNVYREDYMETKDKRYWWQMIQLLPSSYNQRRTVQLNYQVLQNMDRPGRRKDHKLDEWVDFCKWAETLPYFKEICLEP